MKISELAKQAGTTRDTIRHYVSTGLLSANRDVSNGYQIFNKQALDRLRFIKTAQQLGLSLDDIRAIFTDAKQAHSPCPRVRELIQQRITETRQKIAELTHLCNHMESSLAEWEQMPDSSPGNPPKN